jgi:ATP-binding cassette, subfamily B, multidrug efflux pump
MTRSSPISALARHLRWVIPGVLCLVVASGLAQLIPWLVKQAIDAIAAGGARAGVQGTVLALGVVAAVQAGVRILSRIFIFNAGREAEYELRRDLFARLCQLDAGFYRRMRTGDLMSRLTSDLASVRALLGAGLLNLVNTLFAYAVALPLMLALDARLTFWALLPYPVLLLAARAFGRGIHRRATALQAALGSLSATVEEDLAGWRELRSHAVEEVHEARAAERSAAVQRAALSLARWRAALVPVVGLAAGASLVTVLAAGGARVIEHRLTVGALVAFTLYIGLLAWPTLSLGWMLSLWQRGLAAWARLREILEARSPLEEGTARGDGQPDSRAPLLEVSALHVSLGSQRILDGLSLRVPAGSLCALVGPVGAGKTTLAEAVTRLLEVPPGTVRLDGHDVTELPVAAVRARVAYAPQSAFLFSASITENIELGLPAGVERGSDEARARVAEAARAAGLEAELARLPQGLATRVGERGLTLSGGQRQRVALARALVSQRPLLVLDDSLSAVDAETEVVILDALRALLPRRTILLVSHRAAALERADKVLFIERGQVVEEGSHSELMALRGRYAALYRRQLLAELPR